MGNFVPARVVAAALVCVASLGAVGCTKPPRQATAPVPPSTTVWFAGDSIAGLTSDAMKPRPWTAAVGGAGFTQLAPTRILDNTMARIQQYGAPKVILVMGGVNDANKGLPTSAITDEMENFETAMEDLGIRVVWVAEPAWLRTTEVGAISDWLLANHPTVDCRAVAGGSTDGIHPAEVAYMAKCVNEAIEAMGVAFD